MALNIYHISGIDNVAEYGIRQTGLISKNLIIKICATNLELHLKLKVKMIEKQNKNKKKPFILKIDMVGVNMRDKNGYCSQLHFRIPTKYPPPTWDHTKRKKITSNI